MRYEINVARNGQHLFATAERSLTDEGKAMKLAAEIQSGFPDCSVTLTRWEEAGKQIDWQTPPEAAEEAREFEVVDGFNEDLTLRTTTVKPDVSFTKLEAKVLQALIAGLYAEPGFSDVDAQDIARATGIGIQTVGGVLTALTKKDILFVEELSPRTGHLGLGENGEGVSIIYLTEKGEKFHPRWAEENGTEWWPITRRVER